MPMQHAVIRFQAAYLCQKRLLWTPFGLHSAVKLFFRQVRKLVLCKIPQITGQNFEEKIIHVLYVTV